MGELQDLLRCAEQSGQYRQRLLSMTANVMHSAHRFPPSALSAFAASMSSIVNGLLANPDSANVLADDAGMRFFTLLWIGRFNAVSSR